MADAPVSTRALETAEHAREIRIETICERTGWGLIALTLTAALLGLLGPGLLSRRDRTSFDGSIRAEYGLIQRYEAPTELRIGLGASALENAAVRLSVSRSLVDRITPTSISPVPTGIETVGDRTIYTFRMSQMAQRDGWIIVRYQNVEYGWLEYEIGVEGRAPLPITQYILP